MSNVHTFRRYAQIEDQMIRAAMPRTSVADPLPAFVPTNARVRWSLGRRYEQKAAFTFAEVARG